MNEEMLGYACVAVLWGSFGACYAAILELGDPHIGAGAGTVIGLLAWWLLTGKETRNNEAFMVEHKALMEKDSHHE